MQMLTETRGVVVIRHYTEEAAMTHWLRSGQERAYISLWRMPAGIELPERDIGIKVSKLKAMDAELIQSW